MTDEFQGAKEVLSNWMKFENIGDKIKGTLINKRFAKSQQEGMPDQWVYELKKEDGQVWNVGISVNKQGTIQRLNSCKLGEIIGVLFEKELPSSKKGFKPAKSLKVFTFGMDETYSEMETGKEVDGEGPEY
jgi:hypothetical protein